MSLSITGLRVFLASPGGLQEERKRFRQLIEDFNEYSALPRSILFQPVGWEETLGGAGRPQEIINEELRTCDYFLMILWDRWGSRPDNYSASSFTSGTEEEFHVAKNCANDHNRPMSQIVVMFKAVDARQLSDPGEELKKVVGFRRELERNKEYLYHTFDDLVSFESIVRRFLNRWLMDREQERGTIAGPVRKLTAMTQQLAPLEDVPITADAPVSESVVKAQQLVNQGLLTDAESEFARAVANGTDPQALDAYGNFLIRLGRLSQAEAVFKKLEALANKSGEQWKAVALAGRGRVLRGREQLAEAEQMFRAALDLARTLGLEMLRAKQLSNLGHVMSLRGETSGAEVLTLEAIAAFKNLRNDLGLALAQIRLADIHRKQGALNEAETVYKEALSSLERINDEEGTATALNNLALLHLKRREPDLAETYLRKALALNEKLQKTESLAINHTNLAIAERQRKNLESARDEFQVAAEIYHNLGLVEKATNRQSRADKLTKEIDEVKEATIKSSREKSG